MTALSFLRIGRLASRSPLGQQSRISLFRCPSYSPENAVTRFSLLRHVSTFPISLTNHSHASRDTLLLTESTSSSLLLSHSCFLVARRSLATSANTLSLIKKLRTQSGAPIVDCKKALQAASTAAENQDQEDGEDAILEAALDWLREHGAAKAASKVQGRESLQGLVALQIAPNGKSAALVKVASETDFAAQSEQFVQLVVQVANAALQVEPVSSSSSSSSISTNDNTNNEKELMMMIQEIEKVSVEQQGKATTVKDLLDQAIVAIRENISIAQAQKLYSDNDDSDSIWAGYVHNRVNGTNAGTAAAVVQLAIAADHATGRPIISREDLQAVGKKLAMHIVAARPQFLSMDTVPADILNKEREMIHKQIVEEEEKATNNNNIDSDSSSNNKKKKNKKPPEIIAKIAEGKLRKFLSQVCLMDQNHMIEEENPIVSKILHQQGIVVKRFETMSIE